ncbi:MAG: hypothetical protein HUU54_06025 [Ignavibacteriaceae bacterium]|nr:hypothetical protein [Ignavibacteriaceae bacterium]
MKSYLIRFLAVALISATIISCTDELVDNPVSNLPPDTGLFLVPDTTISQQPSKLQMHWWGDDPDGLVIGYYISWDNTNWGFTTRNDSLFALQIGASDTTYPFQVIACDNSGNGTYDNKVLRNGIDFGPEPFIDNNGNGIWDNGEKYYDIGDVDPTPAKLDVPIKNSSPVISWNTLTVLPDTSFPVMTFAWNASDIDGDATISKITICLNDTSDPADRVVIGGNIRLITLRINDLNAAEPLMDILIDGSESNVFSVQLRGLKYNDFNKFFVQAEDISGAKSEFISLPSSSTNWYVKKPTGKFLLIDDYITADDASSFYSTTLNSVNSGALNGEYDVWDLNKNKLPFSNISFPVTLKLFKYIFWYTDTNPSLELAGNSVRKFTESGGKVFFSMQFPQTLDVINIQSFLPVDSTSAPLSFLLPNTAVSADPNAVNYPGLTTTASIARVRTTYISGFSAQRVYYFANNVLPGAIGFINNEKNIFFIGLPLHRCDGTAGNVSLLFNKVLFDEFGLIP